MSRGRGRREEEGYPWEQQPGGARGNCLEHTRQQGNTYSFYIEIFVVINNCSILVCDVAEFLSV